MRIARRNLLKSGLAVAAAVAAPGAQTFARAQVANVTAPRPTRRLIVLLNAGGWDPTFTLDPKPGSMRIDVPSGQRKRFGDLPIWSSEERPAVDTFFSRFGQRVALVNGLQVRSFVHPDCMKRVLTGSASEATPDLCAITAYETAADLPVPYLALGGQARSGHLAAITGRTGTINQLSVLVDPLAAYPDPKRGGGVTYDPRVSPTASESEHVRAYLAAAATRLARARGRQRANRRQLEAFVDSLQRSDALRRFARQNGLGGRDYTLSLEAQIPLAVRALSGGLSRSVLLQTDDWDTHQDNAQQGPKHQALFSGLLSLMEALERAGRLDDTVVVVLSEMGRTPRLNGELGKDHWPVTSAMLWGPGVLGNRVYGGTDDQLNARSVDFASGEPDDVAGKQLQAGNFVSGVLTAVGVDPHPYLPDVEPFVPFLA